MFLFYWLVDSSSLKAHCTTVLKHIAIVVDFHPSYHSNTSYTIWWKGGFSYSVISVIH